jgi:hypothetical protein
VFVGWVPVTAMCGPNRPVEADRQVPLWMVLGRRQQPAEWLELSQSWSRLEQGEEVSHGSLVRYLPLVSGWWHCQLSVACGGVMTQVEHGQVAGWCSEPC